MKLGAKSAPAPAAEPTDTETPEEPADTSADDNLDFSSDSGDQSQTDDTADAATDDAGAENSSSDKPFDDEPFDAGVEADEEEDPKKFIEQLTGKLGQSLRKYTEDKGEPDFELEKFAVNSLLSATHTGEMDSEDQKDIIKKVKKSGKGDENAESSDEEDTEEISGDETEDTSAEETSGDEGESEESTDDSENMFETEVLDEMSLDDWKSKTLIKLYDDGDDNMKHILTRMVTGEDKIDRDNFIEVLHSETDNEEANYLIKRLEELGIQLPEVNEEITEGSIFLKNPKKNNMFQEGSNDILDEYEVYEVVEEGKKKKKKTKKDACYHKVRARYDVWPSAYASGALVKCRKVGAANWGNSTDESVEVTEGLSREEMKKKCTRIAKRKHDKFPSVKATEEIMACIAGKIWADEIKKLNETEEIEGLKEKWSAKYKRSIDCNNPKGFSQRAHCQGRKKH